MMMKTCVSNVIKGEGNFVKCSMIRYTVPKKSIIIEMIDRSLREIVNL